MEITKVIDTEGLFEMVNHKFVNDRDAYNRALIGIYLLAGMKPAKIARVLSKNDFGLVITKHYCRYIEKHKINNGCYESDGISIQIGMDEKLSIE